ncbi:9295_t:CDS:2 [Funneliformis caledonium]|uniref:9295_t:CDS:1 n=1 Tax=Funneliformis caledonium TaxID=1117310 RepID=A0A9N8ZP35_9GLOM|nr:9295_t:CDS:2 [Funneliformis caledonium]
MTKTIKQKNNKHAINSNIDENNSRLNRETRINKNNNRLPTDIKPTFPPTLTANDLIKNAIKSNIPNKSRAITFPYSFIAYRMALTNEYPEDAKSLYNQKNVQIIYDRHMVDQNDQLARGGAESAYIDQDAEVSTFTQNSSRLNDSSPNYRFYEDPGQNSADRELFYILDFHYKMDIFRNEAVDKDKKL